MARLRAENEALKGAKVSPTFSSVASAAVELVSRALLQLAVGFLEVLLGIVTWSGWRRGFLAVYRGWRAVWSSKAVSDTSGTRLALSRAQP